jgi:ribonuclease R/exosome complex exonuclease DIS3/RRP44
MGNKKKVLSIQKNILQVLDQTPNQTFNYKQIASRLGIKDPSGRNHIIKNLKKLAALKLINNPTKGTFQAKKNDNYHRGILDVSNNGTGYIISEDFEDDVKVSSTHHHKAFGGDEVLFYAYPTRGKRKKEAKIIEIVARKRERFVGTLQKRNGTMFVRVSPRISTVDFYIESEPEIKTTDGDRVLISFTSWDETKSPQAKIIEVLGIPGDAETEIHTILAEYGLPYIFDPQIEKEANTIDEKIPSPEIKKRMD